MTCTSEESITIVIYIVQPDKLKAQPIFITILIEIIHHCAILVVERLRAREREKEGRRNREKERKRQAVKNYLTKEQHCTTGTFLCSSSLTELMKFK